MRIYTAPGVNAYTINANSLNTNINLPLGSYNTVVQAWDKCGGVGKASVNVTVSKINLAPPKFLYATEFKAGRIAEYTVNPLTGSLAPTSQAWSWAHWGPVDIASDFGGYRLYVANQGSHDVNAYFINRSNGNLSPVPGSPFAIKGIGHRVVVHPSGHFVYALSSDSSSGYINAFAVQSNGSLKTVPGSPFAGTFEPITIDPSGRYLFASSGSGNAGAVAAFTIDQSSGALTPVPGSPFIVPDYPGCTQFCQEGPTDVAVDSTGKYLYAVLGIEDAIAGFRIDQSTGSLSNLPGSPYPEQYFCTTNTCNFAWTESIDPNGKFIYVADLQSNDFSIFGINPSTGVPTYVGATGNTQGGICVPQTLYVDPSGSFIYSLGWTSTQCGPGENAVLGFSINEGSGSLISVPGSPFGNPDVGNSNSSEEKVIVTR
jgi:6-phosphogluconolactonase (cycloisomerase 2 family)